MQKVLVDFTHVDATLIFGPRGEILAPTLERDEQQFFEVEDGVEVRLDLRLNVIKEITASVIKGGLHVGTHRKENVYINNAYDLFNLPFDMINQNKENKTHEEFTCISVTDLRNIVKLAYLQCSTISSKCLGVREYVDMPKLSLDLANSRFQVSHKPLFSL